MDQISSQEVFVKVVEVKITQFVVANLVGKNVIDGDQDFMGYARRDCSLIKIESPKDQVVLGCGDIDLRAGCHSKFFAQPSITVGDVIDELYDVRNIIAHGDRVPVPHSCLSDFSDAHPECSPWIFMRSIPKRSSI